VHPDRPFDNLFWGLNAMHDTEFSKRHGYLKDKLLPMGDGERNAGFFGYLIPEYHRLTRGTWEHSKHIAVTLGPRIINTIGHIILIGAEYHLHTRAKQVVYIRPKLAEQSPDLRMRRFTAPKFEHV